MKIGLSSYTYGWGVGISLHKPDKPLSFMELIERTKEFDLNLLQVCDNLPLVSLTENEFEQASKKLAEYGIEIEIGIGVLNDDEISQHLGIAEKLGARLMRTLISSSGNILKEEEILCILRRWVPVFEKRGIKLAIENHDHYSVRILANVIETIDSEYCGICLDTANSLGAGEDIHTVLRHLSKHTINLHLKDIYISRIESKQGFSVVGAPLGKGILDIPYITNIIENNGRNANWILEQWAPFNTDIDTTIKNEKKDAVIGVNYLKDLLALRSQCMTGQK